MIPKGKIDKNDESFALEYNIEGMGWFAFPAMLGLGCYTAAHTDGTNIIHTNEDSREQPGIWQISADNSQGWINHMWVTGR